MALPFEQRARVAELERQMRLAASKVDTAFELPRRIDECEPQNQLLGLMRGQYASAGRHDLRHSQPARFEQIDERVPERGLSQPPFQTARRSACSTDRS